MMPLEGIKVVELAEYVAVPAAQRLLADWGATVYKVERPQGDSCRYLGPSFKMIDFMKEDYNHCLDMMVGGNREYVCLDLKDPEGMAALHKLLESADVLSTNWRQKALVKLGLDYETLKKRYPGLIYAQISGYGDDGPEKDSPGYDTICFAARGGWFRTLPQEGDAPMNWPNAIGDLAASMALAGGICGALVKKQKTGLGDRVNVSLYHTALYLISMAIASSTYDNHYPSSRKNPPSPLNNTYATKDGGWIYLCMPVYNAEYNRCMALIGRDDLIDSPVYSDYSKVRAEGRITEVVEIIEEGFRQKDADEWVRIFRENDIPAGKCFEVRDIVADPQAWENSFLRKIDYGGGVTGLVTDTPVRFNSIGLSPLVASKPIGYHTEEVLGQYGYTKEKLAEMKAGGVIVVKEHNYD